MTHPTTHALISLTCFAVAAVLLVVAWGTV